MKKIISLIFCMVFGAIFACAEENFSLNFDEFGYISDNAKIIKSYDGVMINYWFKNLEKCRNASIMFITVEDLQSVPPSRIAYYVLDNYAKKKRDNTLVLVSSPFENRFGIVLGDNLKKYVSYSTLKHIIRDSMYPEFQLGNYSSAVKDGLFRISVAIEPAIAFLKDDDPYLSDELNYDYYHGYGAYWLHKKFYPCLLVILILIFIATVGSRLYMESKVYPRGGFGVKFGRNTDRI